MAGLALSITLDPQLTFWLNLALLAFHVAATTPAPRRRVGAWALLGAACGMGFLTKGFVAWLVPVLVAGPYMLWQRRLGELLRLWAACRAGGGGCRGSLGRGRPPAGAGLLELLLLERTYPPVRRARMPNTAEPFWFYLPVLLLGCLPWLGLAGSGAAAAPGRKGATRDVGFLLIWLLFPLAFFSLTRGKLPTYILPCFTPLALLFAHALTQQLDRGRGGWLKTNAGINGVIGVAGLVGLLVARHRGNLRPEDQIAWLIAAAIGLGLVAGGDCAMVAAIALLGAVGAAALAVVGHACRQLLTQDQIDSKEPSAFIQAHLERCARPTVLLGNDAGLSANLAWELRRTDITVYARRANWQYGLATPAGAGRFVSRDEIAAWIASARRRGSVALVLRVSGADDPDLAALPEGAIERDLRNKLALVFYPRVTTP